MQAIRKESGPDALFVVGSSKHNNEQAMLLRKWVSLWGTNNTDHQARICHSTTVAGVAQTWGYGAMTNSYNDEQNSKSLLFLGSNAAEAHPVSMLHTLHAKENGCKVIVADPRFTRTAAKADKYVRFRSGTDVPLIFGVLHIIFKNGWEDKEYIRQRVYGMDAVKKEVMEKWTPEQASEATGTPVEDLHYIAKTLAENRPGFIIWAMGQTQHNNANGVVRASNILMLALGNVGRSGGGCNIYRGHDNVQGATDVGPNPDTLPGYYPVAVPGSWVHWARVWNVDLEWLKKQYASEALMAKPGMTVSRWIDGVMEKNDAIDQDPNLRMIFFWGHAPNAQIARLGDARGDEEARPDGGARSVSVGERGDVRQGAQGRRLPAADRHAVRDRWLGHLLQPLAAVAREGDRPAVRVAHRPDGDVPARGQARLRRPVPRQEGRQAEHPPGEGQGRRGAVDGRHAEERDQQGRVDHRLHRPVARAAAGAHAQHARLRREDAARARRQGREDRLRPHRRLLRPALALLRHRQAQASRARPTSTTPRST